MTSGTTVLQRSSGLALNAAAADTAPPPGVPRLAMRGVFCPADLYRFPACLADTLKGVTDANAHDRLRAVFPDVVLFFKQPRTRRQLH